MTVIHSEMVTALKKPGYDIIKSLTPQKATALHMAVGLSGEVAELFEGIMLEDMKLILEEGGDIEFFFEGLRQDYELPLSIRVDSFDFSDEAEQDFSIERLVVLAGEILDAVKRHSIYNKPLETERLTNTMHEFYSVFNEMLEGCYEFGYAERTEHNIGKLGKRYVEGTYSDKAAQERADKQ